MFHPSLFDEPPRFDRAGLAGRLRKLAAQDILIGTSSWKYEGWLGQIYNRDRYVTRGKFSRKRFEETCLEEYGEVFPVVCGDFSFYQFPSDAYWQKLFTSAPPSLQFAFKVPEEVTVKQWPVHARYGPRAGTRNECFLNPKIFEAGFALPLQPYRHRVAALIFEFGTFPRSAYETVDDFVRELDPFLAALPPGFRYSVEIRTPEFLDATYLACLRSHNVAHVFNAWARMPELPVQIAQPERFTADFVVARALLRQGRAYEEAVKQFSPYETVQDENPGARGALRGLIGHGLKARKPTFLFVNNRLEGNAPMTIEGVVEEF
ncbi:MAG: DUF72 domain-containing protein [Bryobacteraceae bacterium]